MVCCRASLDDDEECTRCKRRVISDDDILRCCCDHVVEPHCGAARLIDENPRTCALGDLEGPLPLPALDEQIREFAVRFRRVAEKGVTKCLTPNRFSARLRQFIARRKSCAASSLCKHRPPHPAAVKGMEGK